MNIGKMLLFMAAVLIGLGCISAIFPSEGILLTDSTTITFPSLSEVLATEDTKESKPQTVQAEEQKEELSPEEILALREKAIQNDSTYVDFMKNNPARVYMPTDDYLDPFFEKLEIAKETGVRVMHYGDSQIEMDRMSSFLREKWQTSFGGCGVGFMPAVQTVATTTISQSINPKLRQYIPYGDASMRSKEGNYGPMARSASIEGNVTFTCRKVSSPNAPEHAGKFTTLTVIAKGDVNAVCHAADSTIKMTNMSKNDAIKILTAKFNKQAETATINLSGKGHIYGISADGGKGVMVDNVPMRGCSGTIFGNIREADLKAYYNHFNVGLIILQYGGNAVPYLRSDKGISIFKDQIKNTISLFKRIVPNSCIMLIGPSDMATKNGGTPHTYDRLPQVVDSLRAAAIESDVAFWDLFASMGGEGSMVKWVDTGLAGGDYLHFSTKGAEKAAEMLYNTLHFIQSHRSKAKKSVEKDLKKAK
ncbi:MAG: hypothetical protein MJZ29_11845 [Bacteroidaceae bacterium]|nr:hypothetical protein [Bacteroidaceae bacterium]